MFDDEMLEDFKLEAAEMFDESEDGFLKIEKGVEFQSLYNQIFRVFHSLKGASGMFGLTDLQSHMHKLESLFEQFKNEPKMSKSFSDYFIKGIDVAREIFNGESVSFEYIENISDSNEKISTVVSKTVEKQNERKVEKERGSLVSQFLNSKKNESEETKESSGLVFVLDDNAVILESLAELIESDGYEVCKFLNTKSLLEKIENVTPDVIFSDINMPEISGLELIKMLNFQKSEIPIVFISGVLTKEKMIEGMNYGAYGFIEKPYDEIRLLNICKNATDKARAARLLNKSIDYIMYMFSDLDLYLKKEGKDSVRISLKLELDKILQNKKTLFSFKK